MTGCSVVRLLVASAKFTGADVGADAPGWGEWVRGDDCAVKPGLLAQVYSMLQHPGPSQLFKNASRLKTSLVS